MRAMDRQEQRKGIWGRHPAAWAPVWPLIALLGAGAILRVAVLGLGGGFQGDINAFADWSDGMAQHGLGYFAAGGTGNYPAVLWLLWPVGYLSPAIQHTVIRGISIPFDLAIGLLIYRLACKERGEAAGLWAGAFWFLNPAVIVAGPLWGQMDSVGILPMLMGVVLARKHPFLAGICSMVAILVKPQFLIGAVAVGLANARSLGGAARAFIGACIAGAAILLPLGIWPISYIRLLVTSADQYPAASSYAFNIWGALYGFHASDSGLTAIGAGAFLVAAGFSIWFYRQASETFDLLAMAALVALAIFFLPTRVHDRYLIGALAFLAPLAGVHARMRWPLVALSAAFALGMYCTLALNPALGYPVLNLDTPADTVLALETTAAGGWCAYVIMRSAPIAKPGSTEHPRLTARAGPFVGFDR